QLMRLSLQGVGLLNLLCQLILMLLHVLDGFFFHLFPLSVSMSCILTGMVDSPVRSYMRRMNEVPQYPEGSGTIVGDGANIHWIHEDVVKSPARAAEALHIINVAYMETLYAGAVIITINLIPIFQVMLAASLDDMSRLSVISKHLTTERISTI